MGTALFEPAWLWDRVRPRLHRRGAAPALLAVALLGGLGIAVATEIGVRTFNTDWNYVAGYSTQSARGYGPFLLLWALAALMSIAQGLFGALLLPMYGRSRDWMGGLAVAVLGSVPVYVAGLGLVLLPGILLVCLAFLVSCAWWGSGARLLLGIPSGEAADHVVASFIAGSLALTIASALIPTG